MTYSIDHATLKRAAEQLLAIDNAGYSSQFDGELFEQTDADQQFRIEQAHQKHLRQLGIDEVSTLAERLASILQIPVWQAREAALEVCGHRTRRTIALKLLNTMSIELRRLQAQATRRAFAGRRSA